MAYIHPDRYETDFSLKTPAATWILAMLKHAGARELARRILSVAGPKRILGRPRLATQIRRLLEK